MVKRICIAITIVVILLFAVIVTNVLDIPCIYRLGLIALISAGLGIFIRQIEQRQ